MNELGLLQIYTGDGKGKTTSALGLGLRAYGQGFKVIVVQFLKGGGETGECKALEEFGESFKIEQYGSGKFIGKRKPTDHELDLANAALTRIEEIFNDNTIDMLILDEVSHSINKGLVSLNKIISLLDSRPPKMEVIMTGRDMPQELLDKADLISEITPLRHPYKKGVPMRRGVEY